MKTVGVIPARYKSSRFPGKPLVDLNGFPMIIRVCKIVESALGKDNTYVATDDERISEVVEEFGYQAVMTSEDCLTGTDRLWDFAQKVKADCYINIQGDEPLLDPNDIIRVKEMKDKNQESVINCYTELSSDEDPHNRNIPKILVNKVDNLIYMSRLPIPGMKKAEGSDKPVYCKQVCIYAFSYSDLKAFGSEKAKASYESFEDIEILRFFDLGIPVKMVKTDHSSLAIDAPDDVEAVVEKLKLLENEN